MATSLLVLWFAIPSAFGQSLPSAPDRPAATTWQKYPIPSVSPPLVSTPGSRVVVFTKQPGEVQPVQATQPGSVPLLPLTPPNGGDEQTKRETGNPFQLKTDQELIAEIDANRQTKYQEYKNQIEEYNRKLERFQQGLEKDKPTAPEWFEVPLLASPDFRPMRLVKDGYAPKRALLEPGYVVHRRLFFEEKNSDRYGWELGIAQPFVSTAYFYKDLLLWPGHMASSLFERYDTSAGKCPPGSPVAYYLYPPQLTLRGGLVEAGVVVGTVMLLP